MTAARRKPNDGTGDGPLSEVKPETLSATKRREILRAATEVFLSQGYLAANMDEIATGAAVSKATVYKHFGNKKTLFEEIIRGRTEGLLSPIHVDLAQDGNAADVLKAFAHEFIELILQPASLALYRVLIFEAGRNDEIGPNTYRVGGSVLIRRIADFLASQAEQGVLEIEDPVVAAEQFIGLLTGHIQLRALLGVDPDPSPKRRATHITATVRTFLRAYAPRGGLAARR
jgi:TetR/AcrR family transcriptional repressor of mexJK operon